MSTTDLFEYLIFILTAVVIALFGLLLATRIRKYFEWLNESGKIDKMPPSEGWGCPTCFFEYNPEVEMCPDCKTKLIDFSTMPNWTTPKK
jgi:hypothetical protein